MYKKCDYMTTSSAIHVKYGRLSSIAIFFRLVGPVMNEGRI